MNAMIQFFKAHSLKASLPLLLLVTACGEGTPTAQQSDAAVPAAAPLMAAAQPNTNGLGVPDVSGAVPEAAKVEVPEVDNGEVSYEDVLPPSDDAGNAAVANGGNVDAEAVPEPAALAGLAIAAAGLLSAKRKQAA